jgi:hypothetical protein
MTFFGMGVLVARGGARGIIEQGRSGTGGGVWFGWTEAPDGTAHGFGYELRPRLPRTSLSRFRSGETGHNLTVPPKGVTAPGFHRADFFL